jgi:hypothetical protein
LLVLPISTNPALRPNGCLLYDAVNPPSWRARTILGIGPGAIQADVTICHPLHPGAAWARPIC